MFEISSNDSIKITRGDDASFILITDMGSKMQPIPNQYIGCSIGYKASPQSINIDHIDNLSWFTSQRIPGLYTFIYNVGYWALDNLPVDLVSYGIYLVDGYIPNVGDTILINYKKGDASEELPYGTCVEFYIINNNANPAEKPPLKKSFYTTGRVETLYSNSEDAIISYDYTNITNEGNFKIVLTPEDSNNILGGQYKYLFKIKYLDKGLVKYATISNKKDFYNVDDDFSGRLWHPCNNYITLYMR